MTHQEIHFLEEFGPYIGALIALLFALISASVMWGKVKEQHDLHSSQIRDLRRGLYQEDGTLVYVTAQHCLEQNRLCQRATCSKIDELKAALVELGKRVEKDRTERILDMREIATFIGRVDQYMSSQKKNGLQAG